MKKYVSLFILLTSTLFIKAQKAEDIIQKHLQAIGGEKKWDSIQTMLMLSELVTEDGNKEMATAVNLPKKMMRQDIRFDTKKNPENKKLAYYIIINPNEGWKLLPDNKIPDSTQSMSKEERDMFWELEEFEPPFLNYKKKGTKVKLLGTEQVKDKEMFKLLVEFKSGRKEYIYIDNKSYLITKRTRIESDVEDIRNYKEYHKLNDGILFPKIVETGVGTITYKNVKLNSTLNDALFGKPKRMRPTPNNRPQPATEKK